MPTLRPRARVVAVATGILLAGLNAVGQVRPYRPVTDAMLANPDQNEWIAFRRTQDGQGYSPLNQINRQNAHQLTLVWAWTMRAGGNEGTPMVHDGIMFMPNPGGGVQALDAASGELLWEFRTPRGTSRAGMPGQFADQGDTPSMQPMKNVALYGDKVFTNTGSSTYALDARTGKVVWNIMVNPIQRGFRFTTGPIVAKGKIVTATAGCERYKKESCDITALDPETGKALWRTSMVAGPDEPGGDSWGGLPMIFRAGTGSWMAGSYDPATNLIYWGTAQAKPWARFQRGTDGDAKWSNATLALDADTGKIVWGYQHIPGETHDQDETFERVLIDVDGRSSVFSMGKAGVLWELDRKTGAFRAAHDLGYQTLFTINPKTGQVTYRPEVIPQIGVPVTFCPGTGGVKNWRAMAYHPETQAVYIPLGAISCLTGTFGRVPEQVEGGGGTGGVFLRKYSFHPKSPDGLGEFVAMDVRTGRVLWRNRTREVMSSAALTTGGGLALVGNADRTLYIHDVTSGKILYQAKLPNPPKGFITTYSIGGRQYVVVPTGGGGGGDPAEVIDPRDAAQGMVRGGSNMDLTPERRGKAAQAANGLFVFALPANR